MLLWCAHAARRKCSRNAVTSRSRRRQLAPDTIIRAIANLIINLANKNYLDLNDYYLIYLKSEYKQNLKTNDRLLVHGKNVFITK